MRSLYLRILATLAAALVLCLVITLIESARLDRATTRRYIEGSITLELQQAQRVYEEGGPQRLASYLAEVDAALQGQRYLTDREGKDLVSGVDHSEMLMPRTNFLGFPKTVYGRLVIVKSSADSRYHLLVIVSPPLGLPRFVPYLLLVAGVIALFGWLLAIGIVSPLRRLAFTVERFGGGDLGARIHANRKDEIGDLARSFDSMADLIQALLTAERRLLQDISHELRSPLARLSFAAELMKDAPDPEAAADRMKQEIRRLTQLVASLLEVTTAEGDPSSRVVERFAVSAVLEPTVDDCAFEAEARGVRIESDSRSTAEIDGDPELLRRALENVLRNAVRYAPEGSAVKVKIEDSDDRVRISIRDHGPGAPEEALSRIFDPFFRADASRDPTTGNVGLGLAIARRAVLIHHGNITAMNAQPGLRVIIDVPCATARAVVPPGS
jgi:signal transduction histidine kinase